METARESAPVVVPASPPAAAPAPEPSPIGFETAEQQKASDAQKEEAKEKTKREASEERKAQREGEEGRVYEVMYHTSEVPDFLVLASLYRLSRRQRIVPGARLKAYFPEGDGGTLAPRRP